MSLKKVVSGGQTGVDRAALDAALSLNFPCGGYCPKGRRAEDGPLPKRYPLKETDSPGYPERTERNILISDATLILAPGVLREGTALTQRLAQRHQKPLLVASPNDPLAADKIKAWITVHKIAVLNIAGPRESSHAGIYQKTLELISTLLRSYLSL